MLARFERGRYGFKYTEEGHEDGRSVCSSISQVRRHLSWSLYRHLMDKILDMELGKALERGIRLEEVLYSIC
jgi:hypothetical protein